MTPDAGILLVDKPPDWTSHDVVAKVRGLLGRKTKVGHSGTLDPMATGLLILLIGRATKLAAQYQGLPKTYRGRIRLGVETDTGDIEGKIEAQKKVPPLEAGRLKELFDRHHGDVEMAVPRFSAVKHKGKPLYAYAREGIEVPEKLRTSRVISWKLTDFKSPEAGFLLECSSGTYVRALASLVGRELGCGAALSALRRERIGSFDVKDALSMDSIKALGAESAERLFQAVRRVETPPRV
ncbi:MAG: tRNA pseudouridine(55) synthase TruB [Elusimicrobiota bacterium]